MESVSSTRRGWKLREAARSEHIARCIVEEPSSHLQNQLLFSLNQRVPLQIGTFVVFLVKERESKSKHLQFVSGVNAVTYWLATLLFDFCCYLLPSVLIIVVFVAFDIEAYVQDNNFM